MANDAPVTLIIGATGGIGAATARELAARGHRLVLVARRAAPLEALAAALGPDAIAHPGDATAAETSDAAVAAAMGRFGRLDGLIHAVGSIVLKPLHRLGAAEMEAAFQLNVMSAFHAMKAALGPMQAARSGAIVVCSSVAAGTGLGNHEAVATAKSGLEGLVRASAMTYAPANIRINAVALGLTRTPLAAGLTENPRALEASLQVHPLHRLGEPAEVATAIAWLLEAPNVTGAVIPLDGGIASGRPLR